MSLDFNYVFPYIAEIIGCTMFVCLSIPLKFIKIDPIYKSLITVVVISISSFIYILSTQQSEKIQFNLLQNITDHNHIIQSIFYTLSIIGFTIGFQYLPVSIAVPLGALVTPAALIFNKFVNNDLRYWSLCSNQSFGNTRVNDCLFDEEVPVDEDGYFTIFISKLKDKPRNAIKECGYAWLPIAEDGDGVFDEDVAIIQFRHMLADNGFNNSIQSIENQADIKKVMKDYYPNSRYFMKNQVESFFPCS